MLSVLAYAGLCWYVARFYIRSLPLVGVLHFFFVTTLLWQGLSTVYIDLVDEVFSIELLKVIESDYSGVFISLSLFVLVLGIQCAFSSARLDRIRRLVVNRVPPVNTIGGVDVCILMLMACAALLVLAYAEMFYNGVIPAFIGMGKKEFFQSHLGPVGMEFYRFVSLICFFLGMGAYLEIVRRSRMWKPYGVLFLGILFYLFLQGHRFTAILLNLSYFLMPMYLLFFQIDGKRYVADLLPRLTRVLAIWILLAGIISAAVLVNYFGEVDSPDRIAVFIERVLIQQGQMWSATWVLLIEHSAMLPDLSAMNAAVLSPVVSDGNGALYYLMQVNTGSDFYELLESERRYTGASPIVFLVMFGFIFGWVAIFFVGYLVGFVVTVIAIMVSEGRLAAAIFMVWVFMPLNMMIVDGDMSFVTNPVFLLKICLVGFILLVERINSQGRSRVVPTCYS